MAHTQADIDSCYLEVDDLRIKIGNARADGNMYLVREYQEQIKPLQARLENLIDEVHPQIKARREREEAEARWEAAEAKRKAEKESNDRRYRELTNEFSVLTAKPVNDDISSSEYLSRITALDRIKSGLKALPGDYDTAAYIEQCGSLHGVFEKSYNDRKYKELTNELSDIAAQPVNDGISSSTYRSRITALDQIKSGLTGLPGDYDTAAYIKKCDSFHGVFEKGLAAAQTREAKKEAWRRAKMQRAENAKSVGRVILGGLIGAASGGAAIFLLCLIVGHGENEILGGVLVLVGLIGGGIGIPIIFDHEGCLVNIIGAIAGAVVLGGIIFQGIPYIRDEIGLPGICASGAAIGALIGSIVAGKA